MTAKHSPTIQIMLKVFLHVLTLHTVFIDDTQRNWNQGIITFPVTLLVITSGVEHVALYIEVIGCQLNLAAQWSRRGHGK